MIQMPRIRIFLNFRQAPQLALPLMCAYRWRYLFGVCLASLLAISLPDLFAKQKPINIGSRLELFVDDYLIHRLTGQAQLVLHYPAPQEIVLVHDEPWEGSGSGYHSIFQDQEKYRMYYKAWQLSVTPGRVQSDDHPLFCCYAESRDGVHWQKPQLGLYEFQGSKNNNIVFINGLMDGVDADGGHPAVFKDDNPGVSPAALYKALLRANNTVGLYAMQSPDGIHWTAMSQTPIITDGAFDSLLKPLPLAVVPKRFHRL